MTTHPPGPTAAANSAAAKSAAAAKAAAGKAAAGKAAGTTLFGKSAAALAAKGGLGAAAFAFRRAAWPVLGVGSAFASAAWFGAFEITLKVCRVVLPVCTEPDVRYAAQISLGSPPLFL